MHLPDPVNYNYRFDDLPVTAQLLEKQVGYGEAEAPDVIGEIIEGIIRDAPLHTEIRGGYVIIDDFEFIDRTNIRVNDIEFNSGKIITGSLKKSEKIALFLMTAGKGIEMWSRKMIRDGDPLSGYIIDLLGSETVESATDLMQGDLEMKMKDRGSRITNRYSPGYCGWLVQEQQKLFSLFPENFCDISLSKSSLMIPIKSVSGIIGIGKDVRKTAYSCNICDMENCIYRDRSTGRAEM
jgi:hypothetical protein